jgi:hypothetical protein
LTLALSCEGKITDRGTLSKTVYNYKQEKKFNVPVMYINDSNFTELKNPYFHHSVGGKPIEEETFVAIKYDDNHLFIDFECRDNPRIDQNFYTEDNSQMFKQEVFEIFISPGEAASENYWEIQLNPNNALFLGKVNNRYKNDHTFDIELISNDVAKIEHSVKKDHKNNIWKGRLKIPLTLIQDPDHKNNKVFRMNLFRIISNQDQTDPNWKNNAKNATFACWSSTMTKKPNFHVPDYFGFLYLK